MTKMTIDGRMGSGISCAAFLWMQAPLPMHVKRALTREEYDVIGQGYSRLSEILTEEYAKAGVPHGIHGSDATSIRASLMFEWMCSRAELDLMVEALETAARALEDDRRALVYCGGNQFGLTPDDFRDMAKTLVSNAPRIDGPPRFKIES
ncbi:hypothetical protein ACNOYE_39075 [Nannocystaceae bacterium ST9]